MSPTPIFTAPVPWTNQHIILYHGTLDRHVASILSGIDVKRGQVPRDFGQGFYTTTVERQARSRAWQMVQQEPTASPAVLRFEVDRDALAQLAALWFTRGSFDAEDFWSLVTYCRLGASHHGRNTNRGWYDIVAGPVAASWQQRLLFHDADQISFHTAIAAQLLNGSNPTVVL